MPTNSFRGEPELLTRLHQLRGKILVCHCSQQAPCHADAIIDLLAETEHNNGDTSATELMCEDVLPAPLLLDADVSDFNGFFGMRASKRKRMLGRPVRWDASRWRASGEAALHAAYQMRMGLVPPILVRECEPGDAIRTALCAVHPFAQDFPLTKPELKCVSQMQNKDAMNSRPMILKYWHNRAEELKDASLDEIFNVCDVHIRNLFLKNSIKPRKDYALGEFVHLALYRDLARCAGAKDASYIDEFAAGLPIIGRVHRSGRWPALTRVEAPDLTEEALKEKAWEIQKRIARRVAKSRELRIQQQLWADMMKDRSRGQCVGPFHAHQEVDRFVGTSRWIPTERFGVEQKGKIRGVDNAAAATGSELNAATVATEKLQLPSTDTNVGFVKHLVKVLGVGRIAAWVLDEAHAYRQIPIAPAHRRYAVIALSNPDTGAAAYFAMVGHSFGLVSAVYNYNRRAALITEILQNVFFIAARNYYDDKFGFTDVALVNQEIDIVRCLHVWLGADFSDSKIQVGAHPVILGIGYDLASQHLYVTEERKQDLTKTINEILQAGQLTRAMAAKLKGRLEHVATHFWGRFGRTFLRPLAERQYGGGLALGTALNAALRFWLWLLDHGGKPRSLSCTEGQLADVVAFTDGYFPDPREPGEDPQPRVGWVVFERETGASFCGSWDIPEELVAKWLPRKTQIVFVELFAAVLVVDGFYKLLQNQKMLLFVDAEPVEAALVKGYSGKDDMCYLVGLFWQTCARASVAVYIDRVPTDANPSDGASRGRCEELIQAGAVRIDLDPSVVLLCSDAQA